MTRSPHLLRTKCSIDTDGCVRGCSERVGSARINRRWHPSHAPGPRHLPARPTPGLVRSPQPAADRAVAAPAAQSLALRPHGCPRRLIGRVGRLRRAAVAMRPRRWRVRVEQATGGGQRVGRGPEVAFKAATRSARARSASSRCCLAASHKVAIPSPIRASRHVACTTLAMHRREEARTRAKACQAPKVLACYPWGVACPAH